MGKFDWVLQPPLVNEYTYLVDRIEEDGNLGYTADIDKIDYNRSLRTPEFNIDIGVGTALSENGVTRVFDAGRYVIILRISRDEQRGEMLFFDHAPDLTDELIRQKLMMVFSADVANAWLEVRYQILFEAGSAPFPVRLFCPS